MATANRSNTFKEMIVLLRHPIEPQVVPRVNRIAL